MPKITLKTVLIGVLIMILSGCFNTDLENIRKLAAQQWPNNPVMVQVTMAQAILESNLSGGGSKLAKDPHNNLFGIKWPSKAQNVKEASKYGSPITFQTKENEKGKTNTIKAKFISFKNLEGCMAYRKFMMGWEMYDKVEKAKTVEEAAKELKAAGYATDQNYVNELIRVYNEYLKVTK